MCSADSRATHLVITCLIKGEKNDKLYTSHP